MWKHYFSFRNYLVKVLTISSERKIPCRHVVKQHPKSPDVRFKRVIVFSCYQLRADITWSAHNTGLCGLPTFDCKPKINNLDIELLINQNILHFDVPVGQTFFMQKRQGLSNLFDDCLDFTLAKSLPFVEAFPEGVLAEVLHDQVDMACIVDYFYELDYSGMVDTGQNRDLVFDVELPLLIE
jgi:hypothetical protein